jgi:deoxyribodipyrimidine photo-lyase
MCESGGQPECGSSSVAFLAVDPPAPGKDAAVAFVRQHLAHVACDEVRASTTFRGGQMAAEDALASFDVSGYAARRNEVAPEQRRGASQLSPYIRHSLLPLQRVWNHVVDGPARDVSKFRNELLWQEYARHWYARLGTRTGRALRQNVVTQEHVASGRGGEPWDRRLLCVSTALAELDTVGWLVNQTRMWLASHWSVRHGAPWRDGEDQFFAHLLDGSRAANRLGWQWTSGVGASKPYGFSRWQVERRAPGLCDSCELRDRCPIQQWPEPQVYHEVMQPLALRADPALGTTGGPVAITKTGEADVVWLTAESLGDDDPALASRPDLSAVFIFDERLLKTLRLSTKRLIFLTETLAELSTKRDISLAIGDPVEVLEGRKVAVTFAPVPGFRSRQTRIEIAEMHPWPWLVAPQKGSIASFSQWQRGVDMSLLDV